MCSTDWSRLGQETIASGADVMMSFYLVRRGCWQGCSTFRSVNLGDIIFSFTETLFLLVNKPETLFLRVFDADLRA